MALNLTSTLSRRRLPRLLKNHAPSEPLPIHVWEQPFLRHVPFLPSQTPYTNALAFRSWCQALWQPETGLRQGLMPIERLPRRWSIAVNSFEYFLFVCMNHLRDWSDPEKGLFGSRKARIRVDLWTEIISSSFLGIWQFGLDGIARDLSSSWGKFGAWQVDVADSLELQVSVDSILRVY